MVKNKAEEVERADTIRERATGKLGFAREILLNGKKSTWSEFHEALPRKLVKQRITARVSQSQCQKYIKYQSLKLTDVQTDYHLFSVLETILTGK